MPKSALALAVKFVGLFLNLLYNRIVYDLAGSALGVEMKIVCLVLSLVASTSAFCSYEVLMQIDRDNDGPCVRRFDPYTGAYLGSIGRGYLYDPVDMVYRNNVVHVLDRGHGGGVGRVFQFNASTGEPIANFALATAWGKVGSISSLTLTPSGTYLISDSTLTSGASYVNEYTATGGYLTARYWSRSGSRLSGVALNTSNNRFYVSSVDDGKVLSYNYLTGITTPVQEVGASNGPLFMTAIGNYLYYSSNTGVDKIFRSAIGADGTLGSFAAFDPSLLTGGAVIGVGGGHAGFGYACQWLGSQYEYTRFSTNTLDPLGTFGGGVMKYPWGRIEVIIAPEPATMIALAGGLALLVKRRKR